MISETERNEVLRFGRNNTAALMRWAMGAVVMLVIAVGGFAVEPARAQANSTGSAGEDSVVITLDEALQYALRHSTVARLAQTQRDLAGAQTDGIQAPLRPHLSFTGVATRIDQTVRIDPICVDLSEIDWSWLEDLPWPGGWTPPDDWLEPSEGTVCIPSESPETDIEANAREFTISLRGAVLPSRVVRATRTLSELGRQSAEADHDRAREELTLQIVDLYYGVLQAAGAAELLELALEEARLDLEETAWQVEAGSATEVDYLEASARVMQLEGQLLSAKGTHRSLMIRLNEMVGFPLATELVLIRPDEKPPVVPSVERAMQAASARRADIRKARLALEQARAHETIVRAQSGPTLQLFGTFQTPDVEYTLGLDRHGFGQISVKAVHQDEEAAGAFQTKTEGWIIGINGTWNIFDGGARRSELEQAALQVEAAELHLDMLLSGLEADLRRLEAELSAAEKALAAARNAHAAMAEAEERMHEMFQRGAVSKGDLLRIRLAARQADQQVLQAEHNYAKARLSYMQTAGLLFEDWF